MTDFKDTFYKQKFHCSVCKMDVMEWVWFSQMKDEKFMLKHDNLCNGHILIPVFEEIVEAPGIIVGKHSKGRSQSERYKRRTDDFKKNTLPTLTGDDKVHFEKKFGKPK